MFYSNDVESGQETRSARCNCAKYIPLHAPPSFVKYCSHLTNDKRAPLFCYQAVRLSLWPGDTKYIKKLPCVIIHSSIKYLADVARCRLTPTTWEEEEEKILPMNEQKIRRICV